jgi:hypothetical protein
MKDIEYLDNTGFILIAQETPERSKLNVISRFFEFMDDLFDNAFLKSYYEDIKKNN